MTKRKTARIARLISRALRVGARAYDLMQKKRLLIDKAQAAGLPLNTPIELENGEQYELVKPDGKYVYFTPLELKKVPKFRRADGGTTAVSSQAKTAAVA